MDGSVDVSLRRGQRERTGGVELRPCATRIVPAVAPEDMRRATPRRTAEPVPLGAHSTGSPRSRTRATGAPRTLGDTSARAAVRPSAEGGASAGDELDTRSRRTTQARRLRPSDTALVTATTQLLAVVEPEAERRALVPLAPGRELVVDAEWDGDRDADRGPVTIVTATMPPAPSALVRLGAPAPHPQPHARRARVALLSALVAVCMLVAVRYALPLTRDTSRPPSATSHLPSIAGGQLVAPTGPWSTGSGVADTLGLGGGAAPGVQAPGSAGAPVSKQQQSAAQSHGGTPSSGGGSSGISPAPFRPWPPSNPFMYVPGHPSFGMSDVGGYYYWAFGQCTWWAQYKKQNENLTHMGSAMYWAAGAAARGYRTGSAPAAGATVVFQAGVQGAGGYGHVAHVVAVYPGGWFLVSEMNFYVNGGGWGRVDYRYAHTGWGVTFIY